MLVTDCLTRHTNSFYKILLTKSFKSKDKIASFFSSKKVRSSSKELIERFLHSDTEELALLNVFPAIKRVFVQSNTTLPSSAPVERLFSHAGELFSRKRCRLSDKNFEQQLLLQLNKCFIYLCTWLATTCRHHSHHFPTSVVWKN